MAALEIGRDPMDGAADDADVEPEPTPILGQAPMGASDDGASHYDADIG